MFFLSIYFTSPPCLAKQFVPEIQFYLFMSENVPSSEFFLCVNQFVHPVEFLILCDSPWFSPFFPSSFFKIENWINLCTPLNSLFLWFTLIVPHFSLLHFLKIENRINLRTLLNSFLVIHSPWHRSMCHSLSFAHHDTCKRRRWIDFHIKIQALLFDFGAFL